MPEPLAICVAIPVTTIAQAKQEALQAVALHAKYIEFRLDYTPDITKWQEDQFRQLVQSVPVPVILTMRMKSEGGQQEIDERQRVEILRKCIRAKPAFVDLEVRMDKNDLESLYQMTKEHKVGRIYSLHNFQGTPNDIQAETLLNQIKARCPGLKENSDDDSVVKLIFYARCERDNLIVLDVCRILTREHRKSVCFCMGDKGIYSRVMCLQFGALFSYASMNQSTAPGQISISQFYEILQSQVTQCE